MNREVKFCENSKKNIFLGWGFGGGRWDWVELGGQGGCERRIEVFVKIQKKWGGGSGWMCTKN